MIKVSCNSLVNFERNSNIEDALREMGNLVSSRSREPHRHNSESAVPDSESHDDSIFLGLESKHVQSYIKLKFYQQLMATLSKAASCTKQPTG